MECHFIDEEIASGKNAHVLQFKKHTLKMTLLFNDNKETKGSFK
jgi:hypothetical protein